MTKTNQRHKLLRKLIGAGFICAFLCVVLVVCCNFTIKNSAKGKLFDKVTSIPTRKAGLLLGTSPYTAKGTLLSRTVSVLSHILNDPYNHTFTTPAFGHPF